MLGILKVNAGIGTDGSAEFSITLVDVKDQVYEVDIDDRAYAQVVGIIEETTGVVTDQAPEPAAPTVDRGLQESPGNGGNGLQGLSEEKKQAIARLLAGPPPETPQHHVEGDKPQSAISMSDVGFDVDYSADMYEDEVPDPGEDLSGLEDDYVDPL